MENNKKKTLAIVLSIFAITIVIGATYAFVTRTLTGTKKVTLTAGTLSLVLDEKNAITISDALPMYDAVGMIQEEVFNFDLINETNNPTDYTIKLKKVSTGNELSTSDVKYYLTKEGVGTPALLSTLTDGVVDTGTITGGDTIEYSLRLWINEDVTDKNAINGKSLSYKLEVEASMVETTGTAYQDNSGANVPQLTSGMIAVTYDGNNWVKADTSEAWYDYDNQMWANAVTVTENTRDTYMAMDAGEPISMDDINTMWVWIPRYEYQYTNLGTSYAGGTQSQPGEIKINFISSDTITPSDINTYKIPEGFKFGEENIPGFWMGKFETSTLETCAAGYNINEGCDLTTLTPQIKPNVTSWRGARVSTFFEASRLMQSSDDTLNYNSDTYGFDAVGTSSMDSHMLKNTEWGIVAMLSQSKYGKYGNPNYTGANKEVYQNKSSEFITGNSNGTPSTSTTNTQSSYDTEDTGYGASTTGTIYGVYDMSGGASENAMGNYNNISGYATLSNSGFCGINGPTDGTCREWPDLKYYDLYTSEDMSTSYKFGDGTYETSSWYSDYAYFVSYDYPWFKRGGDYNYDTFAGVFSSVSNSGGLGTSSASRFIIKP